MHLLLLRLHIKLGLTSYLDLVLVYMIMVIIFPTGAAQHVLNPQYALTEARLPKDASQLSQETTLPNADATTLRVDNSATLNHDF